MNDLINSVIFSVNNDLYAYLNNHHESIKTAGHFEKANLNDQIQKKHNIQSNQVFPQLLPSRLIGIDSNHSVSDGSLLNDKISQLKCEIINSIIDVVKKFSEKRQRYEYAQDNSAGINNDDMGVCLEGQVATFIKLLLLRLQVLLIGRGTLEAFKFITIYDVNILSVATYKQIFTIVPYIDGQPVNSISEFLKIDNKGILTTVFIPSRVIDGGFKYPGNWINISVNKESLNRVIQDLTVQFGIKTLKGCALSYNFEVQHISKKIISNIYISNLQTVW
jgi:hypothetical protein